MPDQSKESMVSAVMSASSTPSPVMRIARAIAIAVPVVGATPTAYNLYQSFQHGIPFNEVSHRLAQHDLWVKNFDCKIEYRALTVAQGTRVDVGACNKTGDISIKVTTSGGKSRYEWLAFDKLRQGGRAASVEWLIGSAQAGNSLDLSGVARVIMSSTDGPHIAQAAMEVVCQEMVDRSTIIRIVREGGKCYRERFSPFQGTVDKREEVPCTTTCKPTKG